MPRNGSGSYSLPEAAFVPGTTISSSAVNDDFSDIALALTGSVASDGQTPITGPITFSDGTFSAPGLTFNSDTTTGIYRPGSGQVGFTSLGVSTIIVQAASATVGAGLTGISGSVLCPIGVISDFAGTTAPTGWLLCFGQSLLRSSYPELFTVIGTTYGAADGTHFSLPDCRGRLSAGKDNMGGSAANRITPAGSGISGTTLGGTGGSQTNTILQTNLPAVTLTTNITDPGHPHTTSPGAPGVLGPGAGQGFAAGGSASTTLSINSATTGITANTPLGGGGTPLGIMGPTIIFNVIIFAGRP